jgi:hypothetical protein
MTNPNARFRKGIFISYSHKDKKWLDKLMVFLKPHAREEQIHIWEDTQIQPGAKWDTEIKTQIDNCRVAILLVSPYFLASNYIVDQELSLILKKHREGAIAIYWIAISHSGYKQTELNQIQSANNPAKPLDELSKSAQDKTLVEIAEKIAGAMDINAIGNVLKIIDDFFPQQKAFVDNVKVDNSASNYSVQATQQTDRIELRTKDKHVLETITPDDLKGLDKASQTLIRTYEATMKVLFERWTELQPKSFDRNPVVKQDARDEMQSIRQDLCTQLNLILSYLQSLHKNLDDHYHHVRHICAQ